VTVHHFHCAAARGGKPRACDCGVSGPRHWRMDHLPADRAQTAEETHAWRHAIRAKAPPPEHEALAEQFAWTEAAE
jgi:hypothetical protein